MSTGTSTPDNPGAERSAHRRALADGLSADLQQAVALIYAGADRLRRRYRASIDVKKWRSSAQEIGDAAFHPPKRQRPYGIFAVFAWGITAAKTLALRLFLPFRFR